MSTQKTYLGDGVYADVEHGMIKLTAENGIEATDTIYLDPEVFAALWLWAKRSDQTNHGASLSDFWNGEINRQLEEIELDLARLSRAFVQRLEWEREQ